MLVGFAFCISVDELFVVEWGEPGKQVGLSTARKFVASQTTFNSCILGQVLSRW